MFLSSCQLFSIKCIDYVYFVGPLVQALFMCYPLNNQKNREMFIKAKKTKWIQFPTQIYSVNNQKNNSTCLRELTINWSGSWPSAKPTPEITPSKHRSGLHL